MNLLNLFVCWSILHNVDDRYWKFLTVLSSGKLVSCDLERRWRTSRSLIDGFFWIFFMLVHFTRCWWFDIKSSSRCSPSEGNNQLRNVISSGRPVNCDMEKWHLTSISPIDEMFEFIYFLVNFTQYVRFDIENSKQCYSSKWKSQLRRTHSSGRLVSYE